MKTTTYIIGIALIALAIYLWPGCEKEPVNNEIGKLRTQLNYANKTKEEYKQIALNQNNVIDSLEKETQRLSNKKAKIIYRTKFDTLATIDTVLIELVKCDSVVRISDSIIALKDEVIQSHIDKTEHVYDALNECENAQAIQDSIITLEQNKSRKIKQNNTFKAGIIVALNVASIASPPTAILTTCLSILVSVIPFNKE